MPLSHAYAVMGEFDKAIDWAEKIITDDKLSNLFSPEEKYEILFFIGVVQYLNGDYLDSARTLFGALDEVSKASFSFDDLKLPNTDHANKATAYLIKVINHTNETIHPGYSNREIVDICTDHLKAVKLDHYIDRLPIY